MKLAIIGTGPTAWATYKAIQAVLPKAEVTFICPSKRFSIKRDKTLGAAAQKNKFGSYYPYDTDGSNLAFHSQGNYSMANGGLSSTWGAGLRIWPKRELEKLEVTAEEIYQAARALLEELPYTGTNESLGIPNLDDETHKPFPKGSAVLSDLFQFKNFEDYEIIRPSLAIDTLGTNECTGCGECLTGCPYGSIFDSGVRIDNLVLRKKVKRAIGVVEKVSQDEQKVTAYIKTDTKESTQIFDHVFLCAGAIGTPEILMNSRIIPKRIEILDSQVFYFIGIKFSVLRKKENLFALSEVGMYTKNQNQKIYASLYECNMENRRRIAEKIRFSLRLPISSLPKFVDRFLVLGIGFLHSDQSGKIELSMEHSAKIAVNTIQNGQTSKEIKSALRIIYKNLRAKKLMVIPRIFTAPGVGEGFHSGGGAPVGSPILGKNGSISNATRIHVSDTSLLPFLEPGPHTFTAMCLSYVHVLRSFG